MLFRSKSADPYTKTLLNSNWDPVFDPNFDYVGYSKTGQMKDIYGNNWDNSKGNPIQYFDNGKGTSLAAYTSGKMSPGQTYWVSEKNNKDFAKAMGISDANYNPEFNYAAFSYLGVFEDRYGSILPANVGAYYLAGQNGANY